MWGGGGGEKGQGTRVTVYLYRALSKACGVEMVDVATVVVWSCG